MARDTIRRGLVDTEIPPRDEALAKVAFTILSRWKIADANQARQWISAEPYNESLYMSLIPGNVSRQAGGTCN
jgi:hypothetical protein